MRRLISKKSKNTNDPKMRSMRSIILSIIITIGSVYAGIQAIKAIEDFFWGDLHRENVAYESLAIGRSRSYVQTLFGIPIVTSKVDKYPYMAYETKNTYFVGVFDNDSLIAFYTFLKDGKSIKLPYSLFPDKLGEFKYSDISCDVNDVAIDVGNLNMGFSLYEEHHVTGNWGYYYDYIIGDCSIVPPVKSDSYLFNLFQPYDAGKYVNHDIPFFKDDSFTKIRDNSYPNFAGVIKYDYNFGFPVLDFYLSLCGASK